MPYKTKAERDRENWKTIPEVVTDICAADDCVPTAARNQLRRALTAGDLWPLRWQPEKSDRTPPTMGAGPLAVADDLPPSKQVWLEAKIRWKTGRVLDEWGQYNNGKWRVLLMHRLVVADLIHCIRSSAQVSNLSRRKPGGRPSTRNQVYVALRKMQDDGYNMTQSKKRLAEEAAKRSGQKLGTKNWAERTITDHVRKWLRDKGLAKT
jgi:hypothetical protein